MKFYSDSMRFLFVSFFLGLIAMVYTTTFYILNQVRFLLIIRDLKDCIYASLMQREVLKKFNWMELTVILEMLASLTTYEFVMLIFYHFVLL